MPGCSPSHDHASPLQARTEAEAAALRPCFEKYVAPLLDFIRCSPRSGGFGDDCCQGGPQRTSLCRSMLIPPASQSSLPLITFLNPPALSQAGAASSDVQRAGLPGQHAAHAAVWCSQAPGGRPRLRRLAGSRPLRAPVPVLPHLVAGRPAGRQGPPALRCAPARAHRSGARTGERGRTQGHREAGDCAFCKHQVGCAWRRLPGHALICHWRVPIIDTCLRPPCSWPKTTLFTSSWSAS